MNSIRPAWSPQTKLVVSLFLLALFIYLLSRFSIILAPLVLAAILAYILMPLANFFAARLRLHRILAIFLAYLVMLAGISIIPIVIIPTLATQMSGLNVDFQNIIQQIENLLGREYTVAGQVINLDAIFQQGIDTLRGLLQPVFTQTLSLAVEVITSLVWVVFIIVVSFYLIKDSQTLRDWFESLVPPAYREEYIHLRNDIGQIWSAFFRGQLLLALVVATLFSLVGFALGLRFALAMGIYAGLLEFLPSVGHGIWMVSASLLALFGGSTWLPLPNWAFMLVIIGLHLFYQQFDLNYLIPRIIGRRVHLPPLVIILGIFTGAALAGVLGILLAAPTIASARVLGRYLYSNLFDVEPFPESVAPPLPPPDLRWWEKSGWRKPWRENKP
jgi:predicted PurR-regulated permease PerM